MNYHLDENEEKEVKYKKGMNIVVRTQAEDGFTQVGKECTPDFLQEKFFRAFLSRRTGKLDLAAVSNEP